MTTTLDTKLRIGSWDESPYREFDDGRKFTRAAVALKGDGADADADRIDSSIESAAYEGLMFYAADGTSSYVTMMQLTGTLDGRSGSFVLAGAGTYDGTTATGESRIVPGSGTGGLAGISGSASSSSTHADYPFMPLTLHYDLG
ncbi:MAG TPA: DUF3224 domain-containing protein [Nakamurella sp.]|jgi:hypothetical protein